jgi:hypothetical protein
VTIINTFGDTLGKPWVVAAVVAAPDAWVGRLADMIRSPDCTALVVAFVPILFQSRRE